MGMIELKDLYPITFYEYGEAYYGSESGIRFRIAREPLANVHYTPPAKRGPQTLKVTVWPEPLSYSAAGETGRTSEEFSFSAEGLAEACSYLNRYIAGNGNG